MAEEISVVRERMVEYWGNLSTYFEYSPDIRRAIYTTNAIEAMHRQIRKITKTKGAFTSDQAFLKLVYLAIKDISKKWTMPIRNWVLTMQQLHIKFGIESKPSASDVTTVQFRHYPIK